MLTSEYKHKYLMEREVNRVGFIVVSTDRGLCGGLNANMFKATVKEIKVWAEKGVEADLLRHRCKISWFFRQLWRQCVGRCK
ncbi:MAG: F0F1 ATP synthase subunit gamma [Porticoccaceae bacterium]